MDQSQHNGIVSFISGIADDIVRDVYVRGKYRDVTEGYFDPETETGAVMMPVTWGLNRLQSLKLRSVVTPNMITNAQDRDPEYGWAYKNGGIPMWGFKVHRMKVGRTDKYTDIHKAIWLLDDTVVAGKPVWEWARTVLIEWRLKQGLGYKEIANRLTDLGIPTPRGKSAWCQSTIQSLIADFDKLYQYTGCGFWVRRNWQTGFCQERDSSEWVVVENAHPAIISEAEADAIFATTEQDVEKPKKYGNKPESRFILPRGPVRCALRHALRREEDRQRLLPLRLTYLSEWQRLRAVLVYSERRH